MSDLLLEIGTEEIPARFMPDILLQMEDEAQQKLHQARISYDRIRALGTPRRLVLIVENLAQVQEDLIKSVKGPSKKIAFDDQGMATKAALGFARGQGVELEDLEEKEVEGTVYVFASTQEEGLATEELLPELLQDFVSSLQFPKNMLWGEGDVAFVRPIRWLLSLLDDRVIPFTYAGLGADRISQGHRILSAGRVTIDAVKNYSTLLKKAYVLIDPVERRELIAQQIEEISRKRGGHILKDEGLLEELSWLVEYPSAFCGSFDPSYLKLPQEAIVTPMKEHQRYFPLLDDQDQLMPLFIGVRNGLAQDLDQVIKGNEKVLVARLEDAKFFYDQDLSLPFAEMGSALKDIVFQEKLGSYQDKVDRIEKISLFIGQELLLSASEISSCKSCAGLCKNDLNSHMVREFPELQGIMGEYYAKASGLDDTIAQGIREHYMPRFQNDEIAKTIPGMVVSMADKIDSIVGIMGIGLLPTGSQDPYGLRRAALGIVRTVLEHGLVIDMRRVLAYAHSLLFQEGEGIDPHDIEAFMKMRLKHILAEKNMSRDHIEAVTEVVPMSFFSALLRVEALETFSLEEDFSRLLEGVKRAANLAKESSDVSFDPSLMVEESEKRLHQSLEKIESKVSAFKQEKDFVSALRQVLLVKKDLDDFLEHTMVMVDDLEVRHNRLALLSRVYRLTSDIADMSKIVSLK